MSFDEVIAQPAAVRTLRRALERDRVASSYLFEGPSGVGKRKAALALACALLDPDGAAPDVRRRIGEWTHPDVRVFGPREEGSRNIQVEYLRSEILPFAQYAPFEARAAVLVFPEADVSFPEVHPEAANALLKTLEEPRRHVHFVLLSERPDRLLPTIRSRCQSVRFQRLPPAVLERILREHGVREADWGPAVALSDGRADLALELAESGTGQSVLEAALRLDEGVRGGRPGSLVSLAEDLARTDSLELTLDTLATFYRDVAAASLGVAEHGLVFRHELAQVRERARALSPAQASARVERIRRTVDGFERNANRQVALDALLFDLRQM